MRFTNPLPLLSSSSLEQKGTARLQKHGLYAAWQTDGKAAALSTVPSDG